MMLSLNRKTKVIGLLVSVTLIFSACGAFMFSSPQKADAQAFVPVYDFTNHATNMSILGFTTWHANQYWWKEYILDPIVWAFVSNLLGEIIGDVLDWVADANIFGVLGPFAGESAAFVQDPLRFFDNLGVAIAEEYIESITFSIAGGCPEFPSYTIDSISSSLESSFIGNHDFREPNLDLFGCNFNGTISNYEEFVFGNNFYQGGWDGFFSLSQNPSHNPMGSYLMAQTEIASHQQMEIGQLRYELSLGDGFFSDRAGTQLFGIEASSIITPGSVIMDQASHAVGTDLRRMEHADEFSEIVAILFGYLIGHILGGDGLIQGFTTQQIDDERYRTDRVDPGESEEEYGMSTGSLTCTTESDASIRLSYSAVQTDSAAIYMGGSQIYSIPGGSGSGSHVATGLSPETEYTFQLRDGGSVLSTATCPTLGAPGLPPTAPTNFLCGSSLTSRTINLSWSEPATANTYQVVVCRGEGCTRSTGPIAYIANNLTSGAWTYSADLWETTYGFEVQACNDNGCSSWTGPIHCETPSQFMDGGNGAS